MTSRPAWAAALTLASSCSGCPASPPATPRPEPTDACGRTTGGFDCFLEVPTGSYALGAQATDPEAPGYDPHARPDEGPHRAVGIDGFWLQRDEASQHLWSRCVDAGACPEGPDTSAPGHPVTGITWAEAHGLCAWVGGRLPRADEWEAAARGTDGRRFPWGGEVRCPVREDGDGVTPLDEPPGACLVDHAVDGGSTRHPGPYGHAAMAGNVWEWTEDAWGDDVGPSTPREQRGGGFTSPDPYDLRSAARGALPGDQRFHDVGVRCAWPAQDPS